MSTRCTARVTNHSCHNHNGNELITFSIMLPKFLLAQLNTHRAFSRNTESSRAIPTARMISRVLEAPVEPPEWFVGKGGMSPTTEHLSGSKRLLATFLWRSHRAFSVWVARRLRDCGVPKEWANRPLDTHVFVRVLLTTTREGLTNFLHLRDHSDAQDFMQQLADAMSRAYAASQPNFLSPGEWHTPFPRTDPKAPLTQIEVVQQIARAARTSYGTEFDAPLSDANAIALVYEKLAGGARLHASPFEHLACAIPPSAEARCESQHLHRNFDSSWVQYRALFEAGADKFLCDERSVALLSTDNVVRWEMRYNTGLPHMVVRDPDGADVTEPAFAAYIDYYGE